MFLVKVIKKALRLVIWPIDYLLAILCLTLGVLIYKLSSKIKSSKNTIKPLGNQHSKNIILFLGSGRPVRCQNNVDAEYKKYWHAWTQTQLLHPYCERTFIHYGEANEFDIYRLTRGVISIALPPMIKNTLFRKTAAVVNILCSIKNCLKLIVRKKITALETFVPSDQIILCSILGWLTGLPIIAQVMGDYDLSSFSDSHETKESIKTFVCRQIDKFMLALFFKSSTLVLACNKHCAAFSLCNGAHPAKIRLQRYTPFIRDESILQFKDKNELLDFPKNTRKNIVLWSRFAPEKKLIYGLKGALKVLEMHKDIGLILVGSGPMFNEVQVQIAAHPAKERIVQRSVMPLFELVSYIHHSDIALIPLGGYALIEAALLKKPIVAFDIEWHHELLLDGHSGYVADYPDVEGIAQKMIEIIENPGQAQIISENGYKRCKALFDIERNFKREKEIFRKFWEETPSLGHG